ncbi:MAG: hypothetical protein OK454_11350 [Thaumarchaeota archaeon]|nr:hypothetical protein [Nitrososphaerota archaeon]
METREETVLTDEQTAYVKGLRDLADWLEANPQFVPDPTIVQLYADGDRFKALAREIGTCVKQYPDESETSEYASVDLIKGFGPVSYRLYTARKNVCQKVKRMIEVETWECSPLLAPETEEVPA